MALYYLDLKIISRTNSATTVTAKAAYRSGTKIYDPTTGETYDYTRKRGIVGSEILAPGSAPDWVQDRAELWIAVERKEDQSTRRNQAQLAREIILALPVELADENKQTLTRDYIQKHFVERGMIADIAYHDFESHNPHAHVLLTMREINAEGFGKKNRTWNDRKLIQQWREKWAMHVNRELERGGHEARVDHRSLKEQGIDREPQIHLGPVVLEMERKGIRTEQGDIYRAIATANQNRKQQDRLQQQAEIKTAGQQEQLRAASQQLVMGTDKSVLSAAESGSRGIKGGQGTQGAQKATQGAVEPQNPSPADERAIIHQWHQYKETDLERGSAPVQSHRTQQQERSHPLTQSQDQALGQYGQFFTSAIRHELGKNYKPAYKQKIDPANQNIKTPQPSTEPSLLGAGQVGELDADLVTALEQAAHNGCNARKQLSRADWFRAHPEHEDNDWWQARGGYYGTAKREYLKELSRQAEKYGADAVLHPRIDQDIAVRLRVSGMSWNSINKAITEESPIATALPSTEHQSAYLETVIRPTLQASGVRELRETVNRDKTERDLAHEQRLDRLGLATDMAREVRQEREGGLER